MNATGFKILISITILLFSCKGKNKIIFENFADKYQLKQTTNYSYQFERAILYANSVLEDTFAFRLVPTWQTSTLCPKFTFSRSNNTKRSFVLTDLNDSIKECKYINYFPIPVYLIKDEKLGNSENVFVPDNDKCILANINFIDTLWKSFGISRYEPARRHSITIGLILLHELGHLNNGDVGSYISPQAIKIMPGGKIDLSNNKEYKADLFAIKELTNAYQNSDTSSFREKVVNISNIYLVGDFYRAISSGRSEFEVNRDALGLFSGKHSFLNFKSNSYSHPNLYLRFLLMSYALNPDQEIINILQNNFKQQEKK